MKIEDCNWMQVEEYLQHEDRLVIPLGSIEQHGYLSLGVDRILSERVSLEAAEPLGVLVLPSLPYGLTPYFAAYPGSPRCASKRTARCSSTCSTRSRSKGSGASCS